MAIRASSLGASAVIPVGGPAGATGAPGTDGRDGADGRNGADGLIQSIGGVSKAVLTLADIGAQPSTVAPLYTNAAPAIINDLFAEFLSGIKFGLRGDATDQTVKLNYAIAQAIGSQKKLRLTGGYYGVNPSASDRCLTASSGFSIEGENGALAVIYPMALAGPQHSIIKIAPTSAGSLEFIDFERVMIYPGATGTINGGKGLHIDTTGIVGGLNLASLNLRRCYFASGNDYSLYINNSIAKQLQGAPSNSTIEQCFFFDGVYMRGAGDSNRFANVVLRTSSPARNMLDIALVDNGGGSNGASVCIFDQLNVGDLGGLVIRGGRRFEFRGLNAELGNIAGSTGNPTSNAFIDITGDLSRVHGVKFTNGLVALFGNTSATRLIRIDNAQDVDIDTMELSNGTTNFLSAAVEVTANATDTHVGWISSLDTTKFTKLVNDAGTGTRGVTKTPTLTAGWTNQGSGYAPASFRKDRYGIVSLNGLLVGSGITNSGGGVTIFTLPVGFRPAQAERRYVGAVVSGIDSPPVDIFPDGTVVYQGPSGVTQLGLSGISFQTTSFHTSN